MGVRGEEREGGASEARIWKSGFRLTRGHGLCGMGTVPSCSVPPKMSEVECQRSWNNGLETWGNRKEKVGGDNHGGAGGMECQGWSGEEEVVDGKLSEQGQWGQR